MAFLNETINLEGIPKAEEVILQPIEQRYWKVKLYALLIFWFVIAAIAGTLTYFIEELHTIAKISSTVIVFSLFCFLNIRLSYLSFKNKAYAVRTHDIIYQTGWLKRSIHICPFSRTLHCSINSGYFERRFGLATLNIYSASGDDADIAIPGLTTAFADDLRDLILQKINGE